MICIPSILSGYLKGSLSKEEEEFLNRTVKISLVKDEIIHAVMYWGMGLKKVASEIEERALINLDNFKVCFQENFGQSVMKIILIITDKHAELNGISSDIIEQYIQSVGELMQRHGYQFIRMSNLWKEWGMTIDYIKKETRKIRKSQWNRVKIRKDLEAMALKHYFGEDRNYVKGARQYWLTSIKESDYIQDKFCTSLFLTYNSKKLDPIFPKQLPILHLHVIKGNRDEDDIKPWFA